MYSAKSIRTRFPEVVVLYLRGIRDGQLKYGWTSTRSFTMQPYLYPEQCTMESKYPLYWLRFPGKAFYCYKQVFVKEKKKLKILFFAKILIYCFIIYKTEKERKASFEVKTFLYFTSHCCNSFSSLIFIFFMHEGIIIIK